MGQKMNAEYTAFRRREQTSHTRRVYRDFFGLFSCESHCTVFFGMV